MAEVNPAAGWSPSMSVKAGLVVVGLVALLVFPALARKIKGQRFPVINASPAWDLFDFTSVLDFYRSGRVRVAEGFEKFAGNPFVLNTDVQPRIILSPEHIDEVNSVKELDFTQFVKEEFLTYLPCFKFFDPPGELIGDMVRTKLTQFLPKATVPIAEEAALALADIWPEQEGGQWSTHVLKKDVLTLISRLSAIVFTGAELAHNEEWQRITIEVTVNGFIGVMECRAFPRPLQWLVSLVMPHAVKAGRNLERGKALIQGLLDRRAKERQDALQSGQQAPVYTDAIAWLDEMSRTGKYPAADGSDPAVMQLSLAMAAIHTSSDLLTAAIYRMCVWRDAVPLLRDEAQRVISSMGWTKQSLAELRLLDSFLKETQRLAGSQTLVMNRVAMADTALPHSGIKFRKGEQMAISTHWMRDPQFYADPEHFDPWRFAQRRQDPQLANKSHLVSTSVDHTGFSHGRHACPGRFFAASEIKIALATILCAYDFELVDGPVMPPPTAFGVSSISNGSAKIRVRRREGALPLSPSAVQV